MWNLLEALGQDLKFTLRSLRHNPGFTLLAVVVMPLGIGANTAVFSVVNTVLLKPLTYRDPDRIVMLGDMPKIARRAGAWAGCERAASYILTAGAGHVRGARSPAQARARF